MNVLCKAGVSLAQNGGFIFTGQQFGDTWEIDAAADGNRVDGVVLAPVDAATALDETALVLRVGFPRYLSVSGSVAQGQFLTNYGDGRFRVAAGAEPRLALALANDIGGVVCMCMPFTDRA